MAPLPRCILSAAFRAALVISTFSQAPAQWQQRKDPATPRTAAGKPNLTAPAPKTVDGKPDLSGIWEREPAPNEPKSNPAGLPGSLQYFLPKGTEIPMRPAAAELFKQRAASLGAGRPSQRCLPHGIPDAMLYGGPFQLVQTPKMALILYEEFNHFRQIYTDGRTLPVDSQPTWFGYSTGKWDGDAFVIETRGFNDQTWLDDTGHPHTEALHTTERFQRRDFGHMDLLVTIDDPKAYTKPWSVSIPHKLLPDTDLIESICENEKDNIHMGTR